MVLVTHEDYLRFRAEHQEVEIGGVTIPRAHPAGARGVHP